jgi:hypothetical protein
MAYSLGVRCLAEFLGMIIVIYTGEQQQQTQPMQAGCQAGWLWGSAKKER